jgi:hypothetical protein
MEGSTFDSLIEAFLTAFDSKKYALFMQIRKAPRTPKDLARVVERWNDISKELQTLILTLVSKS